VAKRTPDYTKQVSHRRVPAERPQKGARQRGAPDAPLSWAIATFVTLAGGVAIYLWGCTQTLPYLGGPDGRKYVQAAVGSIAGIVLNVLVGVMALYALYPRRFPMRWLNKRVLTYVILFVGMIAVFETMNITVLSPGLIPPVAIFYFVIRNRLKAIAEAEGRYSPTRRDQALEEIRERREERRREKEEEARKQKMIKDRLAKLPPDERR
jgi:signal transduction histidine kinase